MATIIDYPAEIIPGRLYFLCTQQQPSGRAPPGLPNNAMCYWVDQDLVYEPFCADFGPCNLGHAWRFCQTVNHLLHQCGPRGQPVYLLVGPHPHKRANAAALVGIHSVIYLGKRAEEAYAPLRPLEPFVGFRDASCGVPTFTLGVADVIRGISRATEVGFINWHKGEKFDLEEYEHYEQVENGDLNWIVPGKLMAFSGPSSQPKHFGGWRTFTPEDYIEYFREKGVTSVVRLNKKMYEGARFAARGVTHHDLYFPDGTCPSEPIMYRFLDIVEREPGALAVHCKAGLGRTGVLICCYMIKHYGFTAEEAMAYIRVCRPGSVIGPQQHFLVQWAPRLLHEGRAARRQASFRMDPLADMAIHMDPVPTTLSGTTSPARAAASVTRTESPSRDKQVINIVATSRSSDIMTQQAARPPLPQGSVRRSPRLASTLSARSGTESTGNDTATAVSSTPSGNLMALATAAVVAGRKEPNHIVSIPTGPPPNMSMSKSANARGGPTYIRMDSDDQKIPRGASTPPRQPTRAPMPSLNNTPVRQGSSDLSGANTPVTLKAVRAPPSSTKRVLAPNGQPRKIPMAVDFDSVAPSALEDRDAMDLDLELADNWTVSSQPVMDTNYSPSSRVGAFAAAAGRGANAFVEAFRSAVGSHKANYAGKRRL